MDVPFVTEHVKAYWTLVDDCGGDALMEWHGDYRYIDDTEQYVAWMKVGVAFLVHTYGVPENAVVGIFWYRTPHGLGRAPMIAVGCDEMTDEVVTYLDKIETGLAAFDKGMDWTHAPRISDEVREELTLAVNYYQELP